jgi:hypothetical protein
MKPLYHFCRIRSFSICLFLFFGIGSEKGHGQQSDTSAPVKSATDTALRAPIQSVCYVEVNYDDFRNVGYYKLSNGKPLFNIGIIFAANINYDTTAKAAVLHYNEQLTRVLENAATYIKPVQAKGIKVLLSILGNHQGAGISNFPTQAAATAFARQLCAAVTAYGLDGIDFDDEYAEYGTNGTGQPNAYSFVYLVTALRHLMPDKIISLYDYGPAADHLSYNGVTVGSMINYSWNPNYGTYAVPAVPGLTKAGLAPAAVDIQHTGLDTARLLAAKTVSEGYGSFMFYNLPDGDAHDYLSGVSYILYKMNSIYLVK